MNKSYDRSKKIAQSIQQCVAEHMGNAYAELPVVISGSYFPSKTTCVLLYELNFNTHHDDIAAIHEKIITIQPILRMHVAKHLSLRRTPHIRFQYQPSLDESI